METPPAVYVIIAILALAAFAGVAQVIGALGVRRQQPTKTETDAPEDEAPPVILQRPAAAVASFAQDAPPYITIAELAAADNLLIVGNRGSGKTTLLSAILRHRRPARYVFDPHNEPEKWDGATRVIGGGRAFQDIYAALLAAVGTMDARSKELRDDANAKRRFVPFSVISDEWGSVNEEIVFDAKRDDPPGKLVRLLLKEGRKFKISFIASAHGDTNASLGCTGDKKAFENSFDWFIYCGAFVAEQVPQMMGRIPMGRNPEGGTFPLIVVAYSPTTRERRLVDLRGLLNDRTTPQAAPTPQDLEERLTSELVLADGDDEREVYIRELANDRSLSANQIFVQVGGNRNEVLAIIRDERGV